MHSSTRWRWRRTIGKVHCVRLRGGKRPSEREEGVGDRAERRVMVKASPHSTFEMVEPDLLLEFLVVAFDPPTQLREAHQLAV